MIRNRLSELDDVELFGLLAAAATFGTAYAAPLPLEPRVQLVTGVFLATVLLWITKPVPYVVSSLSSVIALYVLGLAETFQDAVIGFASTLVFFFVLLLLIGQSVSTVNLDDWVANRLVSTTSTPRTSVRKLATTLLLLAFLMPSAVARTVTFMPVIDRINDLYDLDDDSDFRRLAYYVIGHLNPLTSLVVMTGGGMAIVTSEIVNASVREFTWVEWLLYMVPPIVLLYAAGVLAASRIYRVGDEAPAPAAAAPDPATDPSPDGGIEPLTFDQKVVVGTLVVAIGLWIAGSFVGLPAIVPAMLAVLLFSLPGVRIITREEIGDISWGVVFLVGAMLSLLEAMRDLGAFDLLVDVLFSGVPIFRVATVTMLVLFGFAVAIRSTFSSVSAALLLLLPILLEFAASLDLDPLYVSLSLPIVLGSAVFLPFNIPTVLVAYERGPLSRTEVASLGLLTLLFGVLSAGFGWFVYWPALEGVLSGML